MDKYHQPLPPTSTNDDTTDDGMITGCRDGTRDMCTTNDNDDDNDDGGSIWRDAGGLYAHIPSRLHCSTTGSVQGKH